MRSTRVVVLALSFAIVLTGCGGAEQAVSGDVCPDPLVFQTDWFPEPEHGFLYQLTRGEGSVDPETGRFSGPLAYGDLDLTVEIRAGGPYTGFQSGTALLYSDDSIFLGFVGLDSMMALHDAQPTVGVMAPVEINPQIIMFDPATYDWDSWDDVKESGAVLNVFGGQYYTEYLVRAGIVDEDQIDPSYNGSSARFVVENGALAQQGFVTQEPYLYEHEIDEWGRPVDYLLIHDSGWEIYSQVLSMRADKVESQRECLSLVVPLVQQAAVDFMADPSVTNGMILQTLTDLDSYWFLSEAATENTVRMLDELGIFGNGPNGTLGDFDLDRVNGVIATAVEVGFEIPDALTAADIVTNEFIDESIGR